MTNRQILAWGAVLIGLAVTTSLIAQSDELEKAPIASAAEQSALNIVALRIAAYNAHNIDAFLAAHDKQVRIYWYPDRLLGEGRAHLMVGQSI